MKAAQRHLLVPCKICHQPVGEPCRVDGKIRKGGAHPSRAEAGNWEADAPARAHRREQEERMRIQQEQREWESPHESDLMAGLGGSDRIWCVRRSGEMSGAHKEWIAFHIVASDGDARVPNYQVMVEDTGSAFRWSVRHWSGESEENAGYTQTLGEAKALAEAEAAVIIRCFDEPGWWKARLLGALGVPPVDAT